MTDSLSLHDHSKCPRCEAWRPSHVFEKTTNGVTRELKTCDLCRSKKNTESARARARKTKADQPVIVEHARPDAGVIALNRLWPAPKTNNGEQAS